MSVNSFNASASSEVFGFTNTGDKVTASATATASSDVSFEDAYNIAKEIANNVALSELQMNINIIQQTISIIDASNIPIYTQTGNILIVMDELIAYQNLPSWLLEKLPGYQSFSKLGIEFTNIHNNRQMCSPSRASFQTSLINTGVQSNIDQPYQNFYMPRLSYDFDTIPKSIKKYNPEIKTAYYGKEHLQDKLAFTNNVVPSFNTNTTGSFRGYGFDTGSMFGDAFYKDGHGIVADNTYLNTILNNTTNDADFIEIDPITNEKTGYVGVLPFLKARLQDNKSFHLQFHITNPHDTQQFYQNFSQLPSNEQLQFFAPFLKEQTTDASFNNPYFYSEFFPDAYVKNNNLVTNYFEQTYSTYCSSLNSLPFLESYVGDYVTSSITNPINDYYNSMYQAISARFSLPNNQNDIKSWKNLINNYYGLIIEADKYVFKIYNFLKNNNMLKNVSVVLISDHGDLMSAHGLKQKGYPFKECVNVPCVVYSSNIPQDLQGTKNNILGSLLDIAPTIDVLMNIRYKNDNFLGESLLQQNNGQLIPRTYNLPVMNIFNDVMNGISCFLDPSYNDTFFNFKYNFNMIIDYDNVTGKLYKYGHFFSILELFRYNFIYNTLIPKLIPLTIFTDPIFLNCAFIKDILFLPVLSKLVLFMNNTYSTNFTFIDAYDKITDQFKSDNNLNSKELTLFIIIMTNYIEYYSEYNYIIPAVYNNFQDIIDYDYPKYIEPFCYNITDDYNEVKNIFYKKNPDDTFSYDSSNQALFTRLNNKLNDLTIKQCMTNNERFTFIIPKIIYQSIFLCFIKFGVNYNNYTKEEKDLISTSIFLNTYDSKYSQQNTIVESVYTLE
jgi:arylsulfatase A-like enzyme